MFEAEAEVIVIVYPSIRGIIHPELGNVKLAEKEIFYEYMQ